MFATEKPSGGTTDAPVATGEAAQERADSVMQVAVVISDSITAEQSRVTEATA
jgi:hypothetical protein